MPSIPPQRFAERRDRLRALLSGRLGVECLLVTSLPNVRYLSGFSGSNAVLVVAANPADDLIGTDGRYRDQIEQEAPDLPTVIDRDTLSATARALRPGPFAVESTLGIGEAEELRAVLGGPVIATGLVESLRQFKDPDEIAILDRAGSITASGFGVLSREIRVGMTELALARRLEQVFGELGAEDRAFDSIVAGGPHSSIPHHQPGERRLERGDLLVIDAGARVAGYHADMSRTFVVAGDPEAWQVEAHALVVAAQGAATIACRSGAEARDIDAIARGMIAAGGHGERFTHGLGHGVGLEIHEAPMIGARSTGTIEADMTITVEPGIYLPGRGGVRIEDTLVVTDSGPRILTEASRDLISVG